MASAATLNAHPIESEDSLQLPATHDLGGGERVELATCEKPATIVEARKKLIGLGVPTEDILVICDHQPLRRELYAEQVLVNAPRQNTKLGRRTCIAAAFGAVCFGLLGLLIGWGSGAVGAIIGAAAGIAVSILFAINANNREIADKLFAERHAEIAGEKITLAVIHPKSEAPPYSAADVTDTLAAVHQA